MIRIFNHYVPRLAFVVLLLDAMLLAAAAGPLHALAALLVLAALGWYQADLVARPRTLLLHALPRVLPALLAVYFVVAYLAPFLADSVGWLSGVPTKSVRAAGRSGDFAAYCAACAALLAARLALSQRLAHPAHPANLMAARMILVGAGEPAAECLQLAASRRGAHRMQVVGCVPLEGEVCHVPAMRLLSVQGRSLRELASAYGAGEIVICVEERRGGALPVGQLLECTLGGVRVIDAAALFEREACQIRIGSLPPSYLIFGGGFDQGWLRAGVKRTFDVVASVALGVLALPLMLAAAVCIRCEDGGPVLYRQQRTGKGGATFYILKFRSMRADAERDGEPRWASAGDARVTRTGAWLRRLRIDELPQVFNVLVGDMSFVGPRPERPYFVARLAQEIPYYDARHSVKPGITGLAQVRHAYAASVADTVGKLEYDLYYVKNNSLFLDLLLLVETVHVVLSGRGSR